MAWMGTIRAYAVVFGLDLFDWLGAYAVVGFEGGECEAGTEWRESTLLFGHLEGPTRLGAVEYCQNARD